jgi:hypothetical protein
MNRIRRQGDGRPATGDRRPATGDRRRGCGKIPLRGYDRDSQMAARLRLLRNSNFAKRSALLLIGGAAIACNARTPRATTLPARSDPSAARFHPPTSCWILPDRPTPADSISVAFTSPVSVDAAPAPLTPAEQFVFAHAYETLVSLNCQSIVATGLAKSWTRVDSTDHWRFVLRSDARFWSGARVTSRDVIATWRSTGQRATAVLARHMADRATIVDDTTLDVRLGTTPMRALASEELAVARRTPGSRWPEGSGRYRVVNGDASAAQAAGRTTLTLTPLTPGLPRVVVHATGVSDARDLVDLGTDVLITDDRALSSYIRSRAPITSQPLDHAAWSWLVVSRGAPGSFDRSPPYGIPGPTSVGDQEANKLSVSLAADVVRVLARPGGGTFWSPPRASCDSIALPQPTVPPSSLPTARVVYRSDEPVARDIAERLVALASSGDHRVGFLSPGIARAGDRVTIAGLAPNDFDAALREGRELAFVVPLRRQGNLGCIEAQSLYYRAPWVQDSALSKVAATIATLIETRPFAYIFTARAAFTLSDGGTLLLYATPPEVESRR